MMIGSKVRLSQQGETYLSITSGNQTLLQEWKKKSLTTRITHNSRIL